MLVGEIRKGTDVRDIVPRVADRFEVDPSGTVVDELGKVFGLVAFDETELDAPALEEDFELVVRPAVKVRGGDDVVTGFGNRREDHKLRSQHS